MHRFYFNVLPSLPVAIKMEYVDAPTARYHECCLSSLTVLSLRWSRVHVRLRFLNLALRLTGHMAETTHY